MTDHDIIRWANQVVYQINPNHGDNVSREDCTQEAICAGLMALRSAQRKSNHPHRRFILLAMQQAVYRLLKKPVPATNQPKAESSPCVAPVAPVEDRDWIDVYTAQLPPCQRSTVLRWAEGMSLTDIAIADGVSPGVAWHRKEAAIAKLRLMGVNEKEIH